MIIGAIVDISQTAGSVGSNATNGAALMHFYNMQDAVIWAEEQSKRLIFDIEGAPSYLFIATTVINTDTLERKWFFDGTEYTG